MKDIKWWNGRWSAQAGWFWTYEDFISKWNSELNRVTDAARQGRGNKLRFYKAIKREFRMEPYLYLNLSPKQKEVLSRFRTSCHNLRIETGRHERPYLPPDRRLCELWWCNPRRDPSFVWMLEMDATEGADEREVIYFCTKCGLKIAEGDVWDFF